MGRNSSNYLLWKSEIFPCPANSEVTGKKGGDKEKPGQTYHTIRWVGEQEQARNCTQPIATSSSLV